MFVARAVRPMNEGDFSRDSDGGLFCVVHTAHDAGRRGSAHRYLAGSRLNDETARRGAKTRPARGPLAAPSQARRRMRTLLSNRSSACVLGFLQRSAHGAFEESILGHLAEGFFQPAVPPARLSAPPLRTTHGPVSSRFSIVSTDRRARCQRSSVVRERRAAGRARRDPGRCAALHSAPTTSVRSKSIKARFVGRKPRNKRLAEMKCGCASAIRPGEECSRRRRLRRRDFS